MPGLPGIIDESDLVAEGCGYSARVNLRKSLACFCPGFFFFLVKCPCFFISK